MLEGGIEAGSASERFRVGRELHETIPDLVRPAFADALENVNRVRRLIECRQQTNSERVASGFIAGGRSTAAARSCEAGKRPEAARMPRDHLDVVGVLKSGGDPVRGARDAGAIEVPL